MKDASLSLVHLSNEQSFRELVLESPVPVIVDFWAPWCGPCRAQAPILENLAGTLGDDIRIVKVNVDELPKLAGRYSVQAIPTLIIFQGGKKKARLVGLQSEDDLRQALDV